MKFHKSSFEHVTHDGDLTFDELREFAPFRWFFVCGFVELWHKLIRLGSTVEPRQVIRPLTFTREYGPLAIQSIPIAWQEEFPHDDWKAIAERQISHAVHNYHLSYAKSLLALTAVRLCANAMVALNKLELLNGLTVCPAIYVADGFNARRWQQIKKDGQEKLGESFYTELKKRTLQKNIRVFDELAVNRSCTYYTVELLIRFLKEQGLADDLTLTRKTARACPNYPSNPKMPAQFETCQGGRQRFLNDRS